MVSVGLVKLLLVGWFQVTAVSVGLVQSLLVGWIQQVTVVLVG
jgi:hypothetical protein